MFDRGRFENSRPDGLPVLEIVAPEPGNVPVRLFVPLRRSELQGRLVGPLAELSLTQVFAYSRGECDRTLEAVYRFPLPGDAAVTRVSVTFGQVEIQAELKERERAEAEYEEARSEGRQAALATRESPDVFTLRLTGLEPEQEVRVTTHYVQLARPEGTGWSLRVPLTTAPRYVREDERGSRQAEGQPLALLRDPGHRFSLDLTLSDAVRVRSSTHGLEVTGSGGERHVRLRDGEVVPDRDCVLTWSPLQEADRASLQVDWHHDAAGGYRYFLARVVPPAEPPQDLAREVVLLVDHSGSMSGPKWEASDWAVTSFISGLTENDTFALGLFHDSTKWFSRRKLSPADACHREEAIEFLTSHRESGGTNLGVALEQALSLDRGPGERARHVLVVTDAEVTDGGRILRLIEDERKRSGRRRVSVLCIDAAPNSLLAHEMAERGGGIARFLTSSPNEEDITSALEEVLQEWSAPAALGLRLEVDHPGVQASGRDVRDTAAGSAIDLGDLASGRTLWVAGRVPCSETEPVTLRLNSTGGEIAAAVAGPEGGEAAGPALKALFGARRVLALEYLSTSYAPDDEIWSHLERMGYDPASLGSIRPGKPGKVYAENAREELSNALRALLVRESLEYGLASAETAFVAVRTEAGHAPEEQVIVPNALPAGWDASFGSIASSPARYFLSASASAPAAPPPPSAMSLGLNVPGFVRGKRSPSADPSGTTYGAASASRQRQSYSYAMMEAPPAAAPVRLWSGAPQFADGEALLFDRAHSTDVALPERGTLTQLTIRFLQGAPRVSGVSDELWLELYVEDAAAPRVRIRVRDLLRQGGRRPLNLRFEADHLVRLVLRDPDGAWAESAPSIEVTVACQ